MEGQAHGSVSEADVRSRPEGQLFAVSFGMGVDSTAVLVELHRRGLRPDAVTFADTMGEKPETYAHVPVMREWLAKAGFPELTIVSKPSMAVRSCKHGSLEQNCVENETLPSLAFGYKGCSMKWKRAPQDSWFVRLPAARRCWSLGLKVIKAIGYDCGPSDSRRSKIPDDAKYQYWYPLREWGYNRERCKAIIAEAGIPVPVKSACFFCPAMHREEVVALAKDHPDLLARAIAMEDGARPHLGTTKGLGRSWSWREYLEGLGLVEPLPQTETEDVVVAGFE